VLNDQAVSRGSAAAAAFRRLINGDSPGHDNRGRAGAPIDWVPRQDKGYSSFDLSVVDEYPLLEKLVETPVPAPHPLWIGAGGTLDYPVYATK
jgi:hypothetical protein